MFLCVFLWRSRLNFFWRRLAAWRTQRSSSASGRLAAWSGAPPMSTEVVRSCPQQALHLPTQVNGGLLYHQQPEQLDDVHRILCAPNVPPASGYVTSSSAPTAQRQLPGFEAARLGLTPECKRTPLQPIPSRFKGVLLVFKAILHLRSN